MEYKKITSGIYKVKRISYNQIEFGQIDNQDCFVFKYKYDDDEKECFEIIDGPYSYQIFKDFFKRYEIQFQKEFKYEIS